tara:strand:- start:126 stop:869 length:744 start_codon:yes stop_codon:yes gene_type:complete
MKINFSQAQRFEKQIILKNIGISGQKKIASSKVLIIGVGGLGCPLVTYLSASGVGTIGIVDHDKVEISNLNRQTLFKSRDIGKYKVIQAKKVITKINNKIKILSFKEKLKIGNIKKIFKNFDIICDGTDNFYTRYLINDYALKYKKILITSAINKFDGHLMKFDFKKKGPCYRCFMPQIPMTDNNCQSEGIFSPLAGVMGSLHASEVIKTILNSKSDLNGNMIVFNALKSEFRKIKISINPKCLNKC